MTPDIGRRTSDGEKSKNNISTPQGGGHKKYKSDQAVALDVFLSSLKCEMNGTSQCDMDQDSGSRL